MPNVGSVTDNQSAAWNTYFPGGSITDKEMLYWGGTGSLADRKRAVMTNPNPGSLADKEIVLWRTTSALPFGLSLADYEFVASKNA